MRASSMRPLSVTCRRCRKANGPITCCTRTTPSAAGCRRKRAPPRCLRFAARQRPHVAEKPRSAPYHDRQLQQPAVCKFLKHKELRASGGAILHFGTSLAISVRRVKTHLTYAAVQRPVSPIVSLPAINAVGGEQADRCPDSPGRSPGPARPGLLSFLGTMAAPLPTDGPLSVSTIVLGIGTVRCPGSFSCTVRLCWKTTLACFSVRMGRSSVPSGCFAQNVPVPSSSPLATEWRFG